MKKSLKPMPKSATVYTVGKYHARKTASSIELGELPDLRRFSVVE